MGQMTRDFIYQYLLGHDVPGDVATLYAVSLLEYEKAQDNIGRNGAVCANPRTGVPLDNPFLKVRDRAEGKLLQLSGRIPADAVAELWAALNGGPLPELPAPEPADTRGAGAGDALEDQIGSALGEHL